MGLVKHFFQDIVDIRDFAITLVGMANTKGGLIYIGIKGEADKIHGVQNPALTVDQIYKAALMVNPPLILPMPQIELKGGREIVKVVVPPGLPNVYNLGGQYFERHENRNRLLTPKRLRKLLMERGTIQFESQIPPRIIIEDLDLDQVRDYLESLGYPDLNDYENILVRRGCVYKNKDEYHPTYAALLLFGKYPQQWLPSATIMAAKFPGTTFSDSFIKQEIRGSLSQQIQQAETFFRNNLRKIVRLVGLTHEETLEYPLEAIREIIVNAVTHRDYNFQGDGIHINIFSDRLEIQSPGRLPGPITLDNLLVSRFSRNPVISQVLSDLGYVERLGYGLTRVIKVLDRNLMPNPIFEEVAGNFRVTLFNKLGDDIFPPQPGNLDDYLLYDLNHRQELALAYLFTHQRISNRRYLEICPDVSTETIRRDLADLVRKGLLIKVGQKKSTYYILKPLRNKF